MSILTALRRKNTDGRITSYMRLRQLIGHLGIFMAPLCFLFGYFPGHERLQNSISAYYYTSVRDLFVGILVGVGFFLVTYKGYELIDNILTTVSGVASLGIALFPCYAPEAGPRVGLFQLDPNVSMMVHGTFAISFFLLLAVISLFLFTLTDPKRPMTDRKKRRNAVYRVCGAIILVFLAALIVETIFEARWGLAGYNLMFWFEFAMLVAFGVSWLVKGGAIWRDVART
jgi:hypothetical protein